VVSERNFVCIFQAKRIEGEILVTSSGIRRKFICIQQVKEDRVDALW
jgi:hypothetical protein